MIDLSILGISWDSSNSHRESSMKLRRVRIENVRSFLAAAELELDGDISIIIGPNGGGKTNLLDAIATTIRRHLVTSWVPFPSATPDIPDRYELQANDAWKSSRLEKHFRGKDKVSRIELELEVTPRDLTNMAEIRAAAEEHQEFSKFRLANMSYGDAGTWRVEAIGEGTRFTYVVENERLQPPTDVCAQQYLRYLSIYDADAHVRSMLGKPSLPLPLLSMPVNRAAGGFQSSVSLAGHNDSDFKKRVDAANSRNPGSIVALAVGRLAMKYRLLLESDSGHARDEFYAQPQIVSLSRVLEELGYGWKLECTNPLTNQYTVRLDKQGTSFLVDAASSGEKELLTYLFAIYAMNVRDALIVVDEPELHLHPRWQRTLLSMFESLASETGNQFVLATHSPMFVSPASIQYVSRVYSRGQESHIVRLNSDELPNAKHLFSIVNSQNNERMFFADKVVLVEGITDRIVFDEVFRRCGVYNGTTQTCEIIDVGGKGLFDPYRKLLNACQVPNAIIADLDYVNELGTPDLKALFQVDERKVRVDVIESEGSKDGRSLVERLDDAVTSGELEDLRALLEYIKSRRRRVRGDLKEPERVLLAGFIVEQRTHRCFILEKGALEAYLPIGYRSKDIERLLVLLAADLWGSLAEDAREELAIIAKGIRGIE